MTCELCCGSRSASNWKVGSRSASASTSKRKAGSGPASGSPSISRWQANCMDTSLFENFFKVLRVQFYQETDPHQSERWDPDPDLHQSKKQDPDLNQSNVDLQHWRSQNWVVGHCKELRDGLLRVENGLQEVVRSYEMSVYWPWVSNGLLYILGSSDSIGDEPKWASWAF